MTQSAKKTEIAYYGRLAKASNREGIGVLVLETKGKTKNTDQYASPMLLSYQIE